MTQHTLYRMQVGDLPCRRCKPSYEKYVPFIASSRALSFLGRLDADLTVALAMYQFYQVMICLLKLDFFAFIGVTIQVTDFGRYH